MAPQLREVIGNRARTRIQLHRIQSLLKLLQNMIGNGAQPHGAMHMQRIICTLHFWENDLVNM